MTGLEMLKQLQAINLQHADKAKKNKFPILEQHYRTMATALERVIIRLKQEKIANKAKSSIFDRSLENTNS